jgi:chemotaxis protein CheX|nr:chemotaxis protein CheX [Candidatus Acidoferrales bacterium]
MKMELIQPFVNSLDAVVAEIMGCSAQISDVAMSEASSRKQGIAARVCISGEIEGSILLDLDESAAKRAAKFLSGDDAEPSNESAREAVCELSNMVVGNAITQLNDRGFKFKVHPPEIYSKDGNLQESVDTEALVLRFDTPCGNVCLDVALKYNLHRAAELTSASVS